MSLLPTPVQLLQRACQDRVTWGQTAAQIANWIEHGGNLAVAGQDGSGRTLCINGIGQSLTERNADWLRVLPSRVPWGGVVGALAHTALPNPQHDLPLRATSQGRIFAGAAQLARRATGILYVLVDDHEELDQESSRVLALLAEDPNVHICTAGHHAPEWADSTCILPALDLNTLGIHLGRVLDGDAARPDGISTQDLAETLHEVSNGLFGRRQPRIAAFPAEVMSQP